MLPNSISKRCKHLKKTFDLFYNDYTKIYPITGGLSQTAHLKGVLKKEDTIILDGISKLKKYFENPKQLKFIDTTFCKGGCIGGPCLSEKDLKKKKDKLLKYLELSKKEKIGKHKGLLFEAKSLKFTF